MSTPREFVQGLLSACIKAGASDLHCSAGQPPHLRLDGELVPLPGHSAFSADDMNRLALGLLNADALPSLKETGSKDGSLSSSEGVRFRFNLFQTQGMLAAAVRRLEERFRPLSELGLSEALYQLADLRDGLVIVTGATGSGKSTTLATLIDKVNRTRAAHIVTIEDPIEYVHKPIKSVVHQRQVGMDTPDFYSSLVASLRQDPDVILVGEIREQETIRTAIAASETGHLVFTTLHAGDCAGAVERLVSVFGAGEQDGIRRQLSLVLRAIIAQHLLPLDGTSATNDKTPGWRRIAASEILMVTPAIANLIATAKSAQIYSAMETGTAAGMQTLEQDLARLWSIGRISETAAMAIAKNVNILKDRYAMVRRKTTSRLVSP